MSPKALVVLVLALGVVGAIASLVLLGGGSEPGGAGVERTGTPDLGRSAVEAHPDAPMLDEPAVGVDPTDPSLVGLHDAAVPSVPLPDRDVGEVVVRVLDDGGVPVRGRWVTLFVDGAMREQVLTGADGTARFSDVPRSGGAHAALGRHALRPESLVAVKGALAELRAKGTKSLIVDLVDSESSQPLGHARWYFTTPALAGSLEPVYSGRETPVRVSAGTFLSRPFSATPTPDYVDWDPPWETVISRYATALRAVHPLRPEADVVVTVVDEGGTRVRDATLTGWTTAGKAETNPEIGMYLMGGFPVEGVPFHKGEPVHVWLSTTYGLSGEAEKAFSDDRHDPLELEVKMVGRRPGAVSVERGGFDEERIFEERLEAPGDAPPPLMGGLHVQVRRSDGRPADGALVRLPLLGEHRTDGEGVIEVEGILAGDYVIRLDEPGLVPVTAKVTVVGEATEWVVLEEPVGATVDVLVRRADGAAVPYARLEVRQASQTAWVDLEEGVQRLDAYTDHEGGRTLKRLEPGQIRVRALWATKSAEGTVYVENRQRKELKLLLR